MIFGNANILPKIATKECLEVGMMKTLACCSNDIFNSVNINRGGGRNNVERSYETVPRYNVS